MHEGREPHRPTAEGGGMHRPLVAMAMSSSGAGSELKFSDAAQHDHGHGPAILRARDGASGSSQEFRQCNPQHPPEKSASVTNVPEDRGRDAPADIQAPSVPAARSSLDIPPKKTGSPLFRVGRSGPARAGWIGQVHVMIVVAASPPDSLKSADGLTAVKDKPYGRPGRRALP